jgi:hypothetical protein
MTLQVIDYRCRSTEGVVEVVVQQQVSAGSETIHGMLEISAKKA